MQFGCACCSRFPVGNFIRQAFKAEDMIDSITAKHRTDQPTEPITDRSSAYFFFGGDIITMTQADEPAECLLTEGETIRWVGSLAHCPPLPGSVIRVDLKGACLIPGMIDPHVHVVGAALSATCLDLSPSAIAQDGRYDMCLVIEALKIAVKKASSWFPWVLATGFDPSQMGEQWQNLNVQEFAQVDGADKIGILVQSGSGHLSFVNQTVLDWAGINADTPQPPGGRIGKLPNGNPSGIFIEAAAQTLILKAFSKHFPLPSHLPPPRHFTDLIPQIGAVLTDALSKGITTLNDAALGITLGEATREEYFIKLARWGVPASPRLASAIFVDEWKYSDVKATDQLPDVIQNGPDLSDAMFFKQAVKFIADGSNQGVTGHQQNPYTKWALQKTWDYTEEGYAGNQDIDPATLAKLIRLSIGYGWQVMAHANGEAAVADVIESFRSALDGTADDLRHRIEHCSLTTDQNLKDMAELGLSPSFLIAHTTVWGDVLGTILGEDRAALLDRCQSALNHKMVISFHSDHPVTPLGPLQMVQDAVTRVTRSGSIRGKEERISAYDALRAVTLGAAWQCRIDRWVGSLQGGKLADLVVLEQSPLKVPAHEIAAVKVQAVYVNGRPIRQEAASQTLPI